MIRLGPEQLPPLIAWADLVSAGTTAAEVGWYAQLVRDALAERPVHVVDLADVPGDAQCAAIAVVGAIVSMSELPLTGREIENAAAALTRYLGRPLDAVIGLDIASVNALWPVHAASRLNLPLLDADGMGRVFPLVRQTTFSLAGLPMTPLVAAGASGETVIIDSASDRHAERLLRTTVNAAGGWLLTISYPATAAQLRGAAIPGSVSRAVALGSILVAGSDYESIAADLIRLAGARRLGRGTVSEFEHRTRPEGPEGLSYPASMVIELANPVRTLRIELADQTVVALCDGAVTAADPDVIFLLDGTTGQVRDHGDIDIGDDVAAFVLPASPEWHTPAGLALAGPQAFGFPFPHPSGVGSR